MSYSRQHLDESIEILKQIDASTVEKMAGLLATVKHDGGRIFFLGVGGSAANASHAVNDFRKLCGIESYSPIDNVSELTARINDEGWENSFIDWLKVSKLNSSDGIFIFSVGGGNKKKGISTNLIKAVDYAKKQKTKVFGIVGRNDGYVYKKGNLVLQVPLVSKNLLTPFSESFQAVVWHCLVSDPRLQINKTKW